MREIIYVIITQRYIYNYYITIRAYTGEDRRALELLRTSWLIDEFQQDLHSKHDYRIALQHLLAEAPSLSAYMDGNLLILGGDFPTWKFNKKLIAEVSV